MAQVFYLQWNIGRGLPDWSVVGNPEKGFIYLCIAYFVISFVLRWIFLPRKKEFKQILVLMIVGVALAEAIQFHHLYLINLEA